MIKKSHWRITWSNQIVSNKKVQKMWGTIITLIWHTSYPYRARCEEEDVCNLPWLVQRSSWGVGWLRWHFWPSRTAAGATASIRPVKSNGHGINSWAAPIIISIPSILLKWPSITAPSDVSGTPHLRRLLALGFNNWIPSDSFRSYRNELHSSSIDCCVLICLNTSAALHRSVAKLACRLRVLFIVFKSIHRTRSFLGVLTVTFFICIIISIWLANTVCLSIDLLVNDGQNDNNLSPSDKRKLIVIHHWLLPSLWIIIIIEIGFWWI